MTLKLTLDCEVTVIPDDEQAFIDFCEEWGMHYLGNEGRRAWWANENTYIRGATYIVDWNGHILLMDTEELYDALNETKREDRTSCCL